MKPLRIALIYPGYPPEESLGGGISTYAQEAAEGLERQGIHVTVLSRTESFQEKIEKKKKNSDFSDSWRNRKKFK